MRYIILYLLAWFSRLWYSITMFVTKFSSNTLPVRTILHSDQLASLIEVCKYYRKDPLNGKFDYLAHPTRLEYNISNKDKGMFGDCDDYAIYWISALLKAKIAKEAWFSFYIFRDKGEMNKKGHAICVYRDYEGQLWQADYRQPKRIEKMGDWLYTNRPGCTPYWGAMFNTTRDGDDNCSFGDITIVDPSNPEGMISENFLKAE